MKTSPDGRRMIAKREGNILHAYQDTVGVWTIGVGHTSAAGEPAVHAGMRISALESDQILSRDLLKFEKVVNESVKVALAQHEFDALVSLAFNIGGGAFAKSTAVKRLNKGSSRASVAEAIMFWNKPKEIIGRRAGEVRQFLGE